MTHNINALRFVIPLCILSFGGALRAERRMWESSNAAVEKRLLDDTPSYSLATDETMRDLVDQFILACEDRHFRVKAVYHIIRGMRVPSNPSHKVALSPFSQVPENP